ncbi:MULTISPECIES: glycosyltransferase family 4 protein [Methanobacterium]|uniref:Glycosyl transferase GT4 family n=2 Tax=Methanobacterium formicicum TaxID=2162 RepID=A0A089ZVA9_METFO|nr:MULTISPECIES: glycosyltransferase family 4 protein [Methanobacterium]AIS32114.1 glycosyl transferase GT4 family [Methanobacterium formicicum]KUK72369.1 MAG: Glycosyltransferase [Methanobacterium sp. 42_16]MBF4474606.1 glycosyltransferase family 4 protein [Methanobacterium formicicum]MDG3547400.1 glycosyltransferase family 4 protein [Methanobacterium formicicum]CEL24652.1 glycosyltransferase [Methanobacterium formicicum]
MKICLISNLYPPNVLGGAEVSVKKVSEELVKKGHEVIVITTPFSENDVEIINGVKIYQVKPLNLYEIYHHPNQSMLLKPLWHIIDLWNPYDERIIKNILKTENPDIVHIHNFKGLSLSSFAPAKSLKIPLVFTAHDYSLVCMRANLLNSSGEICKNPSALCKIYNQIQKHLAKNKVDLLISPSQFVINKLKSNGLFKDVKSKKIPLGIELKDNEKFEKDYSQTNILYVGNLGEHKGVHILLKAFRKIENMNIRLDIVGKGLCSEKLKSMSENDNRIKFHDFLEGKELIKMYQQANLTVVPSIWYDNSPMVIYESFSCRTPVIGSKIGGIPELIEDGFNGYLFEAGNVNELQKLLENLIDSPETLKKLEQGTYESVQRYTMDKHIKQLETEYQKLAK